MSWLILAFCSAIFLGLYDVSKKMALKDNAVLPVLALNTFFSAILFLPLILISTFAPQWLSGSIFFVPRADITAHLLIGIKGIIVLLSWLFGYYAIKHLPLTIVGPINTTRPVITLLGALLIFGERLNVWQWSGIILTLSAIFLLSKAGEKEGIRFQKNKWILCLFLAAFFGAASGLFDKFLLQRYDKMLVQSWYVLYQCLLMGSVMLIIARRNAKIPFRWRNSILLITLFLCAADFVYFYALEFPDSMISVISMIRRSSVVVSFVFGALFFKEKNLGDKLIDLLLILIGMGFLYWGTVSHG